MKLSRGNLQQQYGIQGRLGSDFIEDTATHTGWWTSIVFKTPSAGVVVGNMTNAPTTFDKGETLGGEFTSITLVSGSCYAYKGVR